MDRDFSGKVAIVTGAAHGISRGIALHLSQQGAPVVVADRDTAEGPRVVSRIRAAGGQADFVHMDLSRSDDAEKTVKAALSMFGRLDVLVDNAATLGALTPLLEPLRNGKAP